MLQIDAPLRFGDITVYRDGDAFNVFYPMPQQPQYRMNAEGKPSFSFYKYRLPVDHPNGKKGGGFLLFDCEFVVDEKKLEPIKQELTAMVRAEAERRRIDPVPPLVMGSVTYTKGTTTLVIAEADGTLVQKVHNPGKPSLFGNNIASFGVELTPEGATFFEQAMQGSGGAVSVIYDLWFWAQLPECSIDGYFNATKFYSFYQSVDTDWNLWAEDSYRETIREQMVQTESMLITPHWGGITDPDMQREMMSWATKSLEAAVERNMIEAIAPVSEDQRKVPDGIEDVTRDITNTRITSISIHWREKKSVEWNFAPQGMLHNITEFKDKDGKPLVWNDYARVIDLDDPFFRQLRVDTYVNADFANLPIHSVEVKLNYKGRPMANLAPDQPEGEVVLNKGDAMGKFATYVEDDDWKYNYSYQVNYRGQSKVFQSPEVTTNDTNLTIGVDDVGILSVDAKAGDINWADVNYALVTLTYADAELDVEPIEVQFQLTQAAPTHRVQQVIFQPVRKNYRYTVKYFMKDGREFHGAEQESRSKELYINDTFGGRKTVAIRSAADFGAGVEAVFVDLEYVDDTNRYRVTKNQALNAQTTFFDWTFPVISETAGQVSYSAIVRNKDGTTTTIPKAPATSDTILVPPAVEATLEVEIITDLVDWEVVRLARVSLSYTDDVTKTFKSKDYVFSATKKDNVKWQVDLKTATSDEYTYRIVYYLLGGIQKTVGPTKTKDRALVLMPDEA